MTSQTPSPIPLFSTNPNHTTAIIALLSRHLPASPPSCEAGVLSEEEASAKAHIKIRATTANGNGGSRDKMMMNGCLECLHNKKQKFYSQIAIQMQEQFPANPTEALPSELLPSDQPHLVRRCSLSSALPPLAISKKQLESLNCKIKQQININKKRFQKLLTLNPYFTMRLFTPSNALSPEECHAGSMGKMMRQMDLLLEEGNLLEKEIKKAELKRMQVGHTDPSLRDEMKHHFAFLRRVWVDTAREETRGTLDRIEELNKRVVIIKNSILSVADHQRTLPNTHHYGSADRRAREAVQQSEEYRQLRERWEGLGMKLQAKEALLSKITQAYQRRLSEKSDENGRLQRQVEQLRRSNKELKEKVISCEKRQAKLAERIAELEGEVRKGKNHLKENSEGNSNLILFKQDYINHIKFRKIDIDPNLRRVLDSRDTPIHAQSDKTIESHLQQIRQNQQQPLSECVSLPKEPLSLRTVAYDAQMPEEQKEESTQEEPNSIRQGRSMEGKRGRFARMRSPANTKLLKVRQDSRRMELQGLSPRLRDLQGQGESLAIRTCHFS